jgi:hypothetical protein
MRRLVSLTTVLLAGILGVTAPRADSRAGEKGEKDEIKLSAIELLQTYKANPKAADAKYKGKVVEVKGTVRVFSLGAKSLIGLDGGKDFPNGVSCRFREDQEKGLIALKKAKSLARGSTVRVKGKVKSYNNLSKAAFLENCEILECSAEK